MIRRIWIKGGSGSGKSTLGLALARRLELPCIELDALHHGPNWKAASASELRDRLSKVLDDDRGWVVEGNYDSKLGSLVLGRAELVVWLDFPLSTKLSRLVRRTARRWLRNEELWNGNRETLKNLLWGRHALFTWAVRSHFHQQREWPETLSPVNLVRLRGPHEVAAWLAELSAERVGLER